MVTLFSCFFQAVSPCNLRSELTSRLNFLHDVHLPEIVTSPILVNCRYICLDHCILRSICPLEGSFFMTCMNAGNNTQTRAHRSTSHACKLIKIANKRMHSRWSDFVMFVYILLILFTDRGIFPDVSIERLPSSPIQRRRN